MGDERRLTAKSLTPYFTTGREGRDGRALLVKPRWSIALVRPAAPGKAQGKARVLGDDEVVLIAGAHDWLHRGSVDQTFLYEAIVDVNADYRAKRNEPRRRVPLNVLQSADP